MKKYMAILLCLVITFSLAGCDSSKNTAGNKSLKQNEVVEEEKDIEENENKEVEEEEEKQNEEEEIEESSEEANEKEVMLYFASNEYVETGDESLEKLIKEKRTVKYDDASLEEAVVKELLKGTEKDEAHTAIPSTVKLIGVEVTDGTAFVNFAQDGLSGSSLQEDLTLEQIVKSLKELDSVNKVQFLIDGEKAETLMGHFDISEPLE